MDTHLRNGPTSARATAENAAGPAAEMLGQLVGQFAHDLNNLLATTLIGVELTAQLNENPRASKLLAGAIESIQRQQQLIGAMARAAQACERAEAIDVHALIEACSGELREAVGPDGLELRLDAAHAQIRCDARFLRAALLHLAANARTSMPGGGRFLLTTRNRGALDGRLPEREFLLLTAADVGQGMNDDVRRRAFDAFFSSREDANGLGLTQVRDTVRRAGGSITLETAQGQGTSIHLAFPLLA
jgi:signal transduction histidine kinase